MTNLSLNTLTNLKSTTRQDGEVVRDKDFVAESDVSEIYADRDYIIRLREDLGKEHLAIELVELTSDDTLVDTLHTEKGEPIYFMQPRLAKGYRYIKTLSTVTETDVLKAIIQKVNSLEEPYHNLNYLTEIESHYLGEGCKGKLSIFLSKYKNTPSCQYLLQDMATINKFIVMVKTLI